MFIVHFQNGHVVRGAGNKQARKIRNYVYTSGSPWCSYHSEEFGENPWKRTIFQIREHFFEFVNIFLIPDHFFKDADIFFPIHEHFSNSRTFYKFANIFASSWTFFKILDFFSYSQTSFQVHEHIFRYANIFSYSQIFSDVVRQYTYRGIEKGT